jgi:hypothetical protein
MVKKNISVMRFKDPILRKILNDAGQLEFYRFFGF